MTQVRIRTRVWALLFISLLFFLLTANSPVSAAVTPDLATAATFGILSSTFTRNVSLTTISGDLGYTTISGSGTSTVTGTTYTPSPAQAGIDQNTALTALNSQTCDFTFGSATVLSDLPQPLTPGVYCVTGAQSIGTEGITLSGAGTFIFRSTGPLNTVANSSITLAGSASACNVFWTPVATTLGANSTFVGTDIDTAAITVGSTVNWVGRALLFGGTVTTDTDTITVPTCPGPTPTPSSSPSGTPTPAPDSSSPTNNSTSSSSTNSGSSAACPALSYSEPIITESKRIDDDTIFISWGAFLGIETFNVQYGLENGKWLYSADVRGSSITINNLPPNQPIWVRVAVRSDCTVGIYSSPRLAGGPLLPSAGIDPFKDSFSWYMLTGISETPLSFLELLQNRSW